MAGKKKTFPCGHRGKGQYCHRCRQVEERLREQEKSKVVWKDQLSSSPVSIEHLPKDVAEKVIRVVENLEQGKTYMDFKGKRLVTIGQRQVISIPIGRAYRLICKETTGSLDYIEVITHETYNSRISSGGWA